MYEGISVILFILKISFNSDERCNIKKKWLQNENKYCYPIITGMWSVTKKNTIEMKMSHGLCFWLNFLLDPIRGGHQPEDPPLLNYGDLLEISSTINLLLSWKTDLFTTSLLFKRGSVLKGDPYFFLFWNCYYSCSNSSCCSSSRAISKD